MTQSEPEPTNCPETAARARNVTGGRFVTVPDPPFGPPRVWAPEGDLGTPESALCDAKGEGDLRSPT